MGPWWQAGGSEFTTPERCSSSSGFSSTGAGKGGKTECKEEELLRDRGNRRAVFAGAVAAVIGDWVLSTQAWPDD